MFYDKIFEYEGGCMKPIKSTQVYAMIAIIISIVYYFVSAHSDELLIYDVKETVLILFFLAIIFLPDKWSKYWAIPFMAYPILSVIEIILESQYYTGYFSDYIVEYFMEFAMFIFAGILLLGIRGGKRGMRIITKVLLILFILSVLYKAMWYFVLGDTGYLAVYLLFSIPEAFAVISILSYDKHRSMLEIAKHKKKPR